MGTTAHRLLALLMAGMLSTGCQPHRAAASKLVCHVQIATPLHEALLVQTRQARGAAGQGSAVDNGASCTGGGVCGGGYGAEQGLGDLRVLLVVVVCIVVVVIILVAVACVAQSWSTVHGAISDDLSSWQLGCFPCPGSDAGVDSIRHLRLRNDGSVRMPADLWARLRQGAIACDLSLRAKPDWSLPVQGVVRGDTLLLSLPAAAH